MSKKGFYETNATTERAIKDYNRFIKISEEIKTNIGEEFYDFLVKNWTRLHISRLDLIRISHLLTYKQKDFAQELMLNMNSDKRIIKKYLNEYKESIMLNKKVIDIKAIGVNPSEISHDLTKYYERFTKKQKAPIEKKYNSVIDYVNLLYWLKFVKKQDYYEMAKVLQISNTNVYCRFYDLGWGYCGNFEKNIESLKEEIAYLDSIREKAMSASIDDIIKNSVKKDMSNEELENDIRKNYNIKLNKNSYQEYGFTTKKQYINTLYYLSKCEELTRNQIALFFGTTGNAMYNKLRRLGLNLDLFEAQQNIIKNSRRNYQQIMNTGRNTIAKRLRKNEQAGSNSENLARMQFECNLYNYIDKNKYYYTVCINSNNIIPPKQVDIPILVFDKSSNKIYKFAVEYNGDAYHEKERDENKETELHEIGWIYMVLWEFGNTKTQKEFGNIDCQIENVCQQIKEYVQ